MIPLDEFDDDTPMPLLESLKNQIMIKVKYTPPEKASKALEYVKCQLHVESEVEKKTGGIPEGEKSKGEERKRKSSAQRNCDPDKTLGPS